MASLLEQFAAEDATPHVRQLIVDAVHERDTNPARERTQFNFNRFNIDIDFVSGTVLIEDELNVDPFANEERVSLSEFVRFLTPEPGPRENR